MARYNTIVVNALQNHSLGPMGLPRSAQ